MVVEPKDMCLKSSTLELLGILKIVRFIVVYPQTHHP